MKSKGGSKKCSASRNTSGRKAAGIATRRITPVVINRKRMIEVFEETFDRNALRKLYSIRRGLHLSATELADLFNVKRQAVEQWDARGVPVERTADVDRIAAVVDELRKRFKTQRLPQIARGKLPILDNRTILETLKAEGAEPLQEMFRRWDSYIPGVEPIRAGQFSRKSAIAAEAR